MAFQFSAIDKNNLYHDIRLRIKENNTNDATKSILLLFEDFIERNLSETSSKEDVDAIEPIINLGGTFRRVT